MWRKTNYYGYVEAETVKAGSQQETRLCGCVIFWRVKGWASARGARCSGAAMWCAWPSEQQLLAGRQAGTQQAHYSGPGRHRHHSPFCSQAQRTLPGSRSLSRRRVRRSATAARWTQPWPAGARFRPHTDPATLQNWVPSAPPGLSLLALELVSTTHC